MRFSRLIPAAMLLLGACGRDELEVHDPDRFHRLISGESSVRTLGTGLGFTEGPVWVDRDGGFLVFSDIWGGRLLRWSEGEGVVSFRQEANAPNGNVLDLQGRLLTCEHATRRVTRTEEDGRVVTLADRFEGKRFNSPNDLIVRSDGSIWFTDPTYGLKDRPAELTQRGLYRLEPETGEVRLLATEFDQPNGLCFSPDEAQLFVADSGAPGRVDRFEIRVDGSLGRRSEFYRPDQGKPDGIRCVGEGRLLISAGDGVHLVDADGRLLGKILTEEAVTNLCLGGPEGKTLFITARSRLLSLEL